MYVCVCANMHFGSFRYCVPRKLHNEHIFAEGFLNIRRRKIYLCTPNWNKLCGNWQRIFTLNSTETPTMAAPAHLKTNLNASKTAIDFSTRHRAALGSLLYNVQLVFFLYNSIAPFWYFGKHFTRYTVTLYYTYFEMCGFSTTYIHVCIYVPFCMYVRVSMRASAATACGTGDVFPQIFFFYK